MTLLSEININFNLLNDFFNINWNLNMTFHHENLLERIKYSTKIVKEGNFVFTSKLLYSN